MERKETYTHAELVAAQRAAFIDACVLKIDHHKECLRSDYNRLDCDKRFLYECEANHLYPLTKLAEIPREIEDPEPGFNHKWRFVKGRFEYSCMADEWYLLDSFSSNKSLCTYPTAARLRMWADLMENPTTIKEVSLD